MKFKPRAKPTTSKLTGKFADRPTVEKRSDTTTATNHKLTGATITLVIESLSNSGDGIGRLDDRVVFVPYTMPGDVVRARVIKDKKSFLQATLTEVVTPAVDRVEPMCRYFTDCGGCDWQHIPYELQCSVKAEQVLDTLQRIGGLQDLPIVPILTSDKPLHYRNRIQGQVRNGKFHLMRRASNEAVAVEHCVIADERINRAIAIQTAPLKAGKYEIAVVNSQAEILPIRNRQGSELGFRQVNSEVSKQLTGLIMKTIEHSSSQRILDLYCGRGDWSNHIASTCPERLVTGVDSLPANIQAAQNSAQQQQLANVTYVCDTVEKTLPTLDTANSLCIVDPPRAGLDTQVTEALCKSTLSELLYVSCHVATLARDLKILVAAGYRVVSVQPLDMFPQTAHIECFVYLQW